MEITFHAMTVHSLDEFHDRTESYTHGRFAFLVK
jgi:hypothetical protein